MKLWFKKKAVPLTNDTKEVEVVQLWYVRWLAHMGNYPYSREKQVVECFTSESQAKEFAASLRAALHTLQDHGRFYDIKVEKN